MTVATLVAKEWRAWLRSRAPFAGLTVLSLAFTGLTLVGLWPLVAGATVQAPAIGSSGPATTTTVGALLTANRGLFLFGGLAIGLLVAAAVVAPGVASTAVTGERRAETWDLLLLSGVGSSRLLLGKLLAASLLVLLLLASAVPAFAAAWTFGAIPAELVALTSALVVVTVVAFSAVGVCCSAFGRTPPVAALYAYAIVFFLTIGTLGLALIGEGLGVGDRTRLLLHLNPFAALLSGGGPVALQFGAALPSPLGAMLLPQQIDALGLSARYPLWAAFIPLYLLLTAVLVALASVATDPVHRLWLAWRWERGAGRPAGEPRELESAALKGGS
jgi:ABC-type transport system involved in multi-copper enzyme maturation permease subunit